MTAGPLRPLVLRHALGLVGVALPLLLLIAGLAATDFAAGVRPVSG